MSAELDPMALALLRIEAMEEAQLYKQQHKREFSPWGPGPMTEDCWYPWQLEAFYCSQNAHTDNTMSIATQWMIMAANQIGKTASAGYHFALDMTCDYPDWWKGYRYTHAPLGLTIGVDVEQLRMVIQPELFGEIVEQYGKRKSFAGGWIHKEEIGRIEWSQVTNVARRVEVIGKYGRGSVVLRTGSQTGTGTGSLTYAGTRICRVWADEPPPDTLIGQLNARVINGNLDQGGHIAYTMTPELGATELVTTFMETTSPYKKLIGPVGWDQAPHLTQEKQDAVLSGFPEHEKDMRTKGIPFFGSGLIYTVPDKRLMVEPFQPTKYSWLRFIRAIDLGHTHANAIVWMAFDPEHDIIYLMKANATKGEKVAYHAATANSFLDWAPCVFPPDIDVTEKGSGKSVRKFYAEAGLKNTLDFTNPDKTRYVEPGIIELDNRMKTDRFKVFSDCDEFFREKNLYHRKDGKIHKKNDDVMDAVRYGAMMITRYGVPLGGRRRKLFTVKKSF